MEILSVKWNNLFRQMKKTKSPAISLIYGKEWQGSLGEINYLYAITFGLQNIEFGNRSILRLVGRFDHFNLYIAAFYFRFEVMVTFYRVIDQVAKYEIIRFFHFWLSALTHIVPRSNIPS